MNAFLDPDELYTLTGYKRAADQIRWLEREGIPHSVNSRNKPVVRRDPAKAEESTFELGPVR